MFSTAKNNLIALISVLHNLPENSFYQNPVVILSGSSIGQHTRHVIELYQCLLNGYETGIVSYDNRKRDLLLETNREAAIDALLSINKKIEQPNKDIILQYDLTGSSLSISSNYFREVIYNLEHCTHHQALIKVALVYMQINSTAEEFGVAPSTIQYRKQCAQ